MEDETARWKRISVEIKSVQSMFEEGIENWRRYNACVDLLTVWLSEGEDLMRRGTPEQKQDFFSEIAKYEEKHKILNDSGNFLIETCREPVAAEIKQTLLMLNRRFKEMLDGHSHFQQVEVIGKARDSYASGVDIISQWLKNAEELLAREVPCRHPELKDFLQDLDVSFIILCIVIRNYQIYICHRLIFIKSSFIHKVFLKYLTSKTNIPISISNSKSQKQVKNFKTGILGQSC